jgi:methionyl-tRNA formyltransferase
MAGDAETGVAVMRVEEKLDTGAVCLMERTAIGPDETAGDLHDRLSELGAELMVRALHDLEQGALACWPQHERGVTYAAKIEPGETRIDWSRPAREVHNQIRGLSPHPCAWFEVDLNGKPERVKALRSTLAEGEGTPGTVLDDQLTIACGKGSVRLLQVQRAGKRPMPVAEFRRGAELPIGSVLA